MKRMKRLRSERNRHDVVMVDGTGYYNVNVNKALRSKCGLQPITIQDILSCLCSFHVSSHHV